MRFYSLVQITKMLCSGKFGLLRLLLLIWCVVESLGSPIVDDYENYLEAEFSSASNDNANNMRNNNEIESTTVSEKWQQLDLSAKKDDFHKQLLNILTPRGQQAEQLKADLDEVFQNTSTCICNKTVYTEHSDHVADDKSCGNQKECVEISMCRNSTRLNYDDSKCNYHHICCHISDKIGNRPEAEMPARMQECGHLNVNSIGISVVDERNSEAKFGEFPWMIALLENVNNLGVNLLIYIGGGSLLAPNVVLTAAHKVRNKLPNELTARSGEWDSASTQEIYTHQDLGVKQIITHENLSQNIALLVLMGSFNPSPHISPICLPRFNENFDYSTCHITGWGKRDLSSSDYPHILKKITLPVLPHNECNDKLSKKIGQRFTLEQSSICAGGEKNVDSCLGDGGAPLVCPIKDKPNRYYQAGILTMGIDCGLEDVPAIYTNVPHFKTWINRELNKLNVESKYYTV